MQLAKMLLPMLAVSALSQFALAQEPGPEVLIEVEDESLMVDPLNITVEEIEEMFLYSAEGDKVGEIESVLGTSDGTISAIAVEVGGFLGIDEHSAVIPLDLVTAKGLRLTIDMPTEQIRSLTEWPG